MSVIDPAVVSAGAAGDEDFSAWIGREEQHTQRIEALHVAAMAATLDLAHAPAEGDALPPGWQWLFFNPMARRSGLGEDGHPKRGGFLPPIALPRRMWAGSRLRYLADVPVGATATRTSRILKVENKTGRRGQLWFVTVGHTVRCDGRDCIVEEQDIVYREPPAPGSAAPTPEPAPANAEWHREVTPDTTLLFRYSALTFNGHRIHYDAPYAREVEGYPALVVHGPLTATLLQDFALGCRPGGRLAAFDFRGAMPLHVDAPFTLQASTQADGTLKLWARSPGGGLAMTANATLA